MISLSHIFSPLRIGDEKLLQRSFDESTQDVPTVFQGACSHPGFWVLGGHGRHSALLREEQGNNEGQLGAWDTHGRYLKLLNL